MSGGIPARQVEAASSHIELLGIPGAYTRYAMPGSVTKWTDVCCPGCAAQTYVLNPAVYDLVGSDDCLTSITPITFACCGWAGGLLRGVWEVTPL